MVGEHTLIVERRRLKYELTIRHKINIILGDSGTGKSLLDNMVYSYRRKIRSISVKSDLKVSNVINEEDLQHLINDGYNLLILDEDVFKEICGKNGINLARYIVNKPVYCIIITREAGLTGLPVDINAVYYLEESVICNQKVVKNVQRYTWNNESAIKPDMIFTEDKKLGYLFYKNTLSDCTINSLGGTGGITKLSERMRPLLRPNSSCFLIADGCAFGLLMPYFIEEKVAYKTINGNLRLFLPPSFEYLVLVCGIIPRVNLELLVNAYKYSKVEKYMSLEKYYEDYLNYVTQGKLAKNSSSLEKYILQTKCVDKIYECIKEIER